MTARVVDHFEAVKIQIAEHVLTVAAVESIATDSSGRASSTGVTSAVGSGLSPGSPPR